MDRNSEGVSPKAEAELGLGNGSNMSKQGSAQVLLAAVEGG